MVRTGPGREVRIAADGDLGLAVGEAILELLTAQEVHAAICPVPTVDALADWLAGASFGVRVSWRDVGLEFESFARAATLARLPWLAVAFAHPYVRIGPAICAGVAPCHACYMSRRRQHDQDMRSAQLERAYAKDSSLGVSGYLPHLAMMAAGQALALSGDAVHGSGPPVTGEVRLLDCRSDEIERSRVVPVHRCQGCRLDPDSPVSARDRRGRLKMLARTVGPDAW